MNLTTAVTSISKGMQGVVRTINTLPVMVAADVDIESLLSGDGAASSSLSGLDDAVNLYGKGVYSIGRNAVIYVAAVALMIFFIGLAVHANNAQKRSERKDASPSLVIGIVGAFAVPAILVFLQAIGKNLF